MPTPAVEDPFPTPDRDADGVALPRRARRARRFPGPRLALDLVAVALLAVFLAGFALSDMALQHDLRTYLYAGRCVRAGGDPYSPADLTAVAGHDVFPYVYPPITLPPFVALGALPTATVAAAWMWGRLALLALLVAFWWRRFGREAGLLPIALAAVFGWNRSALWDLASGNLALVEATLLWAGLACYLRGRRGWFAGLVVLAACAKLVPALFLLLLLVPDRSGRVAVRPLLLAVAALCVLVGGPLLVGPAAHWERFWTHLPDAGGQGDANPGALGLATAVTARLGVVGTAGRWLPGLAFALYAAALVALALPWLLSLGRRGDRERLVLSAVCLYVLLAPRPMAYGFVLVTPVPFALAPRPFRGRVGALLLACVLCAQGFSRNLSIQSNALAFVYAPFLLTLCIWLLIRHGHDESRRPPAPVAA